MSEAEKEIIVETEHAMLDIPAHAVEIEINAKVYLDGELKTVLTVYDFDSIRTAIKEAEYYIALDYIYRDSLMQNGFTREEAVELCKTYTFALLIKPKERETDE